MGQKLENLILAFRDGIRPLLLDDGVRVLNPLELPPKNGHVS